MTTFSYDGSVLQQYTVATTGDYEITVEGAQGGGLSNSGGKGAEVVGEAYIVAGTVLDILVGGAGADAAVLVGGGGGGASYVVEIAPQNVALLVAGGGGGSYEEAPGKPGQAGFATVSKGGASNDSMAGGGDGGLTGDGQTPSGGGIGGASYDNGGAGGTNTQGDGGYGGGGAGAFSGGGGGGYEGGAGGAIHDAGAGGASYADYSSLLSEWSSPGVQSGDGQVTIDLVCFAQGTRISTPRGEVAIERLAVGDLVLTAAGEARPIRWLGHRKLDLRAHPRPAEPIPVRIAADAFGPGRPGRDLYVSPAHALGFDVVGEVLVPAGRLLNGATVDQADLESVVYWHIELETHDLLLAENQPAESYLDVGNRGFFQEGGVVALQAGPDGERRSDAAFCRPFHVEGPIVEALRQQTRRRAAALGWRLERRPAGLHLIVDGARVEPARDGRLRIPAGAGEIWLVSEASRPCDVGDSADERRLGVAIASLTCDDGFASRTLAARDPGFGSGFYEAETDGDTTWRWMSARARLPAQLWAPCQGDVWLDVELAAEAPPHWAAPEGLVMSRAQRRA